MHFTFFVIAVTVIVCFVLFVSVSAGTPPFLGGGKMLGMVDESTNPPLTDGGLGRPIRAGRGGPGRTSCPSLFSGLSLPPFC